jgi:hypothetical protein
MGPARSAITRSMCSDRLFPQGAAIGVLADRLDEFVAPLRVIAVAEWIV